MTKKEFIELMEKLDHECRTRLESGNHSANEEYALEALTYTLRRTINGVKR